MPEFLTRLIRRGRIEPGPPRCDPPSWGEAAARGFAQACAMGLVLPSSALYPGRDPERRVR